MPGFGLTTALPTSLSIQEAGAVINDLTRQEAVGRIPLGAGNAAISIAGLLRR
jgi:hypothetical protein